MQVAELVNKFTFNDGNALKLTKIDKLLINGW